MIKVICVGKIKEQYLKDGINEYLKRLQAFDNVSIVEVKEVNTPDIKKNIELEGKNIIEKINDNDFVITLEILGKKYNSLELADFIKEQFIYGNSKLCFIIGGSNGLSEEVRKLSKLALSFSNFTFPHQLMRLILIEQIYRAYTIINNKEYHK